MPQRSCSGAPCHAQDEQPLSALIALTQHLEGARFPDYWQTADSCKSILGAVPGYYDAIRKYILYVISVTCQKVTSSLLAESLRLDEAGVDALVRQRLLHSNLLAVRCKPGSHFPAGGRYCCFGRIIPVLSVGLSQCRCYHCALVNGARCHCHQSIRVFSFQDSGLPLQRNRQTSRHHTSICVFCWEVKCRSTTCFIET